MPHGIPVPQVLAFYSDLLKEVYDPYIRDNATKKTILLDELERTSDFTINTPFGLQFYVPIILGLPQGHNTTGENGVLPNAGRTTSGGASWTPVQVTGRINFSFRAQNIGDNKQAVWQSVPTMEMENTIKTIRQSVNRQLYGNGSGFLASCGVMALADTVVPITDSTRYIFAHAANGMFIDIIDSATGLATANNRQVLAKTANTITISGANVQTAATDRIVTYGSYNSEIGGLGLIVGNAVLAGINPGLPGNEEWQGVVIDAQNAGPSVPLFERGFQAVEDNGGEVKFVVTDSGVYRAAAAYLTSFKRIPAESSMITLPGGQKGIDWNGVALTRDGRDCPANTAYFIDTEVLKFAQISDGGWQDLGGDIVHWDGQRGYSAVWIWDMNMVCHARNRLCRMANIAAA